MKLPRSIRLAAVALGVTAGGVLTAAPPAGAASGCNHDLCISTDANQQTVTKLGSTIDPFWDGEYHVHVWMSAHPTEDYNTPPQKLAAGEVYVGEIDLRDTEIASVHRGETICAELWLWRQGRYHSRGLPCITH
jgi:hypothetical protein